MAGTIRHPRLVAEGIVVAVAIALAAWAILADERWWEIHWYRHYCSVDAPEVRKALALRVTAVGVAIVLAVFVRPRLGRWTAARSSRALLARAAPLLLAVVASLPATELILRSRQEKGHRIVRDYLWHVGRQHVEVVVGTRKVGYDTNDDGIRTRTRSDVLDKTAPTIVISGESVALGYGLQYDETIGATLTRRTGIATANLAISGQGNDQALDRLQKLLPRFERPIAVVSFVVTTWLERNADESRPHMVLDRDGRLVWSDPTSELIRTSPLLTVMRSIVPYRSDAAIEVTRAILRETASFVRSRGAHPLFVITQCGPHCLDPDPWIARRLVEGLGAPSLRVETYDLILERDIHPNPEGAARYAAAIERSLRESHVVP